MGSTRKQSYRQDNNQFGDSSYDALEKIPHEFSTKYEEEGEFENEAAFDVSSDRIFRQSASRKRAKSNSKPMDSLRTITSPRIWSRNKKRSRQV